MTAARARGSQRVHSNSERGKDRLEGLQPVVEDWHAKVCLLGVRLYIIKYLHDCEIANALYNTRVNTQVTNYFPFIGDLEEAI